MKKEHGKHRRHKRKWRNFWREWRDEQRRMWREQGWVHGEADFPVAHFPPAQMLQSWREFFHDFMGAWPESHWAFGGRRFNPWHQGIAAFNPFVASILSKGGGLLPIYVMHLLDQQPRYGNELMELIAYQTGGHWLANPGAIYPLMTMLEHQGFVEGEWEDPRKRTVRVYNLTKEGKLEMERVKAVVRPKLREAIEVMQKLAQELNGDEGEEQLPESERR